MAGVPDYPAREAAFCHRPRLRGYLKKTFDRRKIKSKFDSLNVKQRNNMRWNMLKVFTGVLVLFLGSEFVGAQVTSPGATFPFQLPGLDLNFSGGGARVRGMGGAFQAMNGDLSTIGFNPAGLTGLDRTQTAIVYRYFRPGVQTRQFFPAATSPDIDYKNIDSFDQIDFGGVAAPGKLFGRPVVGAVAYNVFSDQFFADQARFTVPTTVFEPSDTSGNTTTFNSSRQVAGKLSGFNLGGATRIGRVSVGISFQIYQGGFSDTVDFTSGTFPYRRSSSDPEEPRVDKGRLANKVSYRGSSLILGAQADYRNARVGVSARIPSFTLGETDFFRLKSNMDIGFSDSVFLSGLLYPNLTGGLLFFTDSRLELPLSLAGGVSYRLKSLLVNFDYTYTNWGAADLKVRRIFEAPFSNYATIKLGSAPVNLTSTHQLRFGWEYTFKPSFGELALRGGVRNLPIRTLTSLLPFTYTPVFNDSLVVDAQGNIIDTISTVQLVYAGVSEDAKADGFGISAGVGIRWNQIVLDAAYDYSTYLRTSRIQTPFQGEITTLHRQRQHRVFVGFTGYFTRL